ncbi:unnamed protein product [Phytomonas sp. EM1]|nr:unnamed protein product [Phytomonas sp. EM1]|eukprot:CCW65052.1 unnamed protein product [Phytomonas sp. isolate EM1]
MLSFDYDTEPSADELATNYKQVLNSIREASGGREVQLVAASKSKSPACIKCLYDQGHRVFGENYVQEVVEKARELPQDIQWHFIGHLQSNKVRELLLGVPSLCVVETVDSDKLADKLNTGCERYREGRPLDVFLQVNTSGEESKSGTEPGPPTIELAAHLTERCPLLRLRGLMTIGMKDYTSRPENFTCLMRCREEVAQRCGVPAETLALSMGMSGDYQRAIEMGSTTVRVGSVIFGQRVSKHPKQAG